MNKTLVLENRFRLVGLDCCSELSVSQLTALSDTYDNRSGNAGETKTGRAYDIPQMPMQVHEVLIRHQVIENPARTGSGKECLWVAEQDWVYMTQFPCEIFTGQVILTMLGLDVLVDVYLNETKIGCGHDVFLPLSLDVTGRLREQNTLLLHFHSPHHVLESMVMPERYRNKIMSKDVLIRGYPRGYGDYLGFKPYLTRMGVYDEIHLKFSDSASINDLESTYELSGDLQQVNLTAWVHAARDSGMLQAEFDLALAGTGAIHCTVPVIDGVGKACFTLDNPRLWWCVGYGDQNLYTLSVRLKQAGEVLDRAEKTIGFRKIDKKGDFDFTLNGLPLKLWGANLAPVDSLSGCYNQERTNHIVKMVLQANMNCLRVWGGGDRLSDIFYERCDQLGLLLWQDFFHDYSMYPDDAAYRGLCRREGQYQVSRLKHHPCILLWCGSNESVMCRDFSNPGEDCIGFEIYNEDYRQICAQQDPNRCYVMTSPDGGAYANDPLAGDTHSYTSTWFVPGSRQPVFLSENMRSFPPAYRSLVRMIGVEKLWPSTYTGQTLKNTDFPWPDTWRDFTSAEGWKKISEVENFYDANDAESMIYRFGASVAEYITHCVGRYRRGRPAHRHGDNVRLTKGHLWWKMNTSSPHIYSGLLDYYLEPSMPYYALKRSYAPFTLSFDIENFITAWAVNDTRHKLCGRIYIKLFHLGKNEADQFFDVPFEAEPDQSVMITDLNRLGQFTRNEHVLYAKAVDEQGLVLSEIIDYVDIERHIQFPDCHLTLMLQKNELIIQTDRFARCVELIGNQDGDQFGWEFSDNYFDLLPGQIKKVLVSGIHRHGLISAKGYYSRTTAAINYEY